jgi:hypothetical protein
MTTLSSKHFILFQALFSFFVFLFFWDFILLQPFKTFYVALHESFHGLATILSGGAIISMNLQSNSGHLISSGGFFPFISAAGYLGTSISGSLLILFTLKGFHQFFLSFIALLTCFISFLYSDSYFSFSFFISILISFFILFFTWKFNFHKHLAIFLGTFFSIGSFQDIRTYFFSSLSSQTDAGILARYFGFDFLTLPIAFSFAFISLFIWFISIRSILKSSSF